MRSPIAFKNLRASRYISSAVQMAVQIGCAAERPVHVAAVGDTLLSGATPATRCSTQRRGSAVYAPLPDRYGDPVMVVPGFRSGRQTAADPLANTHEREPHRRPFSGEPTLRITAIQIPGMPLDRDQILHSWDCPTSAAQSSSPVHEDREIPECQHHNAAKKGTATISVVPPGWIRLRHIWYSAFNRGLDARDGCYRRIFGFGVSHHPFGSGGTGARKCLQRLNDDRFGGGEAHTAELE